MTTKSQENKQWDDPKDYGLPWVEVLPLSEIGKAKSEQAPVGSKIETPPAAVEPVAKEEPIEAVSNPEPISKPETVSPIEEKTEEPVGHVPEEPVPFKNPTIKKPSEEAKKSSKTWIWIAAVLVLTFSYIIFWQMQNSSDTTESELIAEAEEIPETPAEKNQETPSEISTAEEIQDNDNQGSSPDSITSAASDPQTPETGTTIDQSGESTLIRIDEKAARPQYFIVVGSLPNERMALGEADQYFDRAESVYLILPYEDVKNYRLAIGQYSSFTQASQDLERVKADYTEALWILKY